MKKLIPKISFIFLLFLSANVFAEYKNSVVLKFGITPYSQLTSNIEYSEFFDVRFPDEKRYSYPNVGTVLYAEYYRELSSSFNLGIGVSQQLYRKPRYSFDPNEELQLCFTSFYLSPKLKIYKDLYGTLHLGFSKLWTIGAQFERDTIGLYYALGVGYEYKNFIFEFLYSVNHAKHEYDILEIRDVYFNIETLVISQKETYETFNFNIGYKVDFNFLNTERDEELKKLYNENSLVLKFGITPYSILTNDIAWRMDLFNMNETETTNAAGASVAVEYFRGMYKYLSIGIGFSQRFDRDVKEYNNLHSLSLYLTPKINVYKNLYLVMQFGGSYIYLNESKTIYERGWDWERKNIGLRYGAGIGYSYKNIIFEFLYSSDNAVYEFDIDADRLGNPEIYAKNYINHQTFNFNIGYKFNFNSMHVQKAKKREKSERDLLIEQNELLKKQIELLEQKIN